jgi:dihydropyrimidinase
MPSASAGGRSASSRVGTITMDLAIRGGTVVTDEGRADVDLGVTDGRISQVGGRVPAAETEIEASGLLVLPGGVDMHVHLSPSYRRPLSWADDFASGSRAAAAGGITTVGNITPPRPDEPLDAAMFRVASEAEEASLVDFVIHPVVGDPGGQRSALRSLAAEGFGSLKIFMAMPEFEPNLPGYLDVMATAADLRMAVMLHCEDASINAFATDRLLREGRGTLDNYPASRPRTSETAAVARAIAMTEVTGATSYVVHVAGEASLGLIRNARQAGLPIHAETRPLYLHLTDAVFAAPDAGLYVGNPPIGPERDRAALWDGLRTGAISTVGSDHAPWRRADKLDPSADVRSVPPGVPELETLMPMLFSEGVHAGRMTLERFVAVTATMPARIFGIHPRKGTIAPGSDADLAIWDPSAEWVVRAADGQSRSDYSPYEGWDVTGRVLHTIRRGEVIWSAGRELAGATRGRRVRRLPSTD